MAPVPITATRLPSKLTGSCGQRAVWKDWPWNVSTPSIRGMVGADSGPIAVIRNRALDAAAVFERHVPGAGFVLVVRGGDAAAELDVAAQVELVGDMVEVAQGLRLAGEMLGPVPFLQQFVGERVAVGIAFGIETCARIAVPVPGAADAGAGLEHPNASCPSCAQAIELVQAGNAGADDDGIILLGVRHSFSLPCQNAFSACFAVAEILEC